MSPPGQLLTIAEVAKRMNVSRCVVYGLIAYGKLRFIDLTKGTGRQRRTIRFRPEWIEEFLEEQTTTPPPRVQNHRTAPKKKYRVNRY